MDALGARRNRREHDVGRGNRKVRTVVLAEPDKIHAERVGEHGLLEHIADDLRMAEELTVRPGGDVAECIKSKFEWMFELRRHRLLSSVHCSSCGIVSFAA